MIEKSLEYFKNRLSKTLSDKRREAYQDAVMALEKLELKHEQREEEKILAIGIFCTECKYASYCFYTTKPFGDGCRLRSEKSKQDIEEVCKAIDVIYNHVVGQKDQEGMEEVRT